MTTPASPLPSAMKPPEGYATWLDYLFEHSGSEEFNAASEEWRQLREEREALPTRSP